MKAHRRLFVLLRGNQLGSTRNWFRDTREALKSQNFHDYPHLCAQKVKFTDFQFGGDVTKQTKDITDENKVTKKLLDENKSLANRSSGRGRAGFRGSLFLG